LNLLIEYFKPTNKERHQEYLTCLKENIKNTYISKIHIFTQGETPELESDKISIIKSDNRPTYKDFFEYCNNNLNDEICIVSNSDIIFDNSLGFINPDNIKGKFLALSRWDYNADKIKHYDIPYSQDSWIFKSPVNIPNCKFKLGTLGCDNRITYLAMKSGLIVTNPSKKIITKHLHTSDYRTVSRDVKETIKGMYLLVDSNDSIDTPSYNIVSSPDEMGRVIDNLMRRKMANNI